MRLRGAAAGSQASSGTSVERKPARNAAAGRQMHPRSLLSVTKRSGTVGANGAGNRRHCGPLQGPWCTGTRSVRPNGPVTDAGGGDIVWLPAVCR